MQVKRSVKVLLGLVALAGMALLVKKFFAKKAGQFSGSPEDLQLAWGETPPQATLDALYEARYSSTR